VQNGPKPRILSWDHDTLRAHPQRSLKPTTRSSTATTKAQFLPAGGCSLPFHGPTKKLLRRRIDFFLREAIG
jgi:hypothetical protein